MNEQREKVILNYIEGYNKFDVKRMVRDFAPEVVFQNIQNGETNMTLSGINDFERQAEQAKAYFDSREQKITQITHSHDTTEVEIDYSAVLAMDFPNGLKKGDKLFLKGKTIFIFKNNKIIKLIDES